MNKSDLVSRVSDRLALHPRKAETVVNIIIDSMVSAMKENHRVEVRGFGSFVMREYRPYIGRNPKTGERIQVRSKRLPFFKTGKDMRSRVNH